MPRGNFHAGPPGLIRLPGGHRRLWLLQVIVLGLFVLLVARPWGLQVLDQAGYGASAAAPVAKQALQYLATHPVGGVRSPGQVEAGRGTRMSERAKRGDAAALAALRKADPVIAVMIDANPDFDPDGWLRLLPKMDEFGVLIFQVAGQQLSVAVTRTMLNRLTDQFGGKLPTPRQVLAADPESIRAAGFSHRKVQTLRELAQRFVDGRLDPKELRRLPDEEVVARLIEVPGVGRWTAEGFLTIALRRDDVVLAGDLALRKAIQQAYALDHLPSQSEVLAIAEPWRPYRSLAVKYLFASVYQPHPSPTP